MKLSDVLTKAKSIEDINDIFAKNDVNVKLGWVHDQVTVGGYEDVVTTDFIAHRVISSFRNDQTSSSSKALASTLDKKIFSPLKHLVESPQNQCSLYQLAALTRVGWTPPPDAKFGRSVALKHAMVLGLLDDSYGTW